jgi:membrane protease YdiL (CAAX protease family)
MKRLIKEISEMNKLERQMIYVLICLYAMAIIVRLFNNPIDALVYIGINIGIILLIVLTIDLTRDRKTRDPEITKPLLELSLGLIAFHSLWRILPAIPIKYFNIGSILKNNMIYVLPVLFIALLQRSFPWKFTFSFYTLRKNLLLFIILFSILTVPSCFYAGTIQAFISGSLNISWIPVLFTTGFVYNLASAGFREELFYRGFIQSRLSLGLNSKLNGLVISSVFFGIIHTSNNLKWGYGNNIFDAFAESILIQTSLGFLYGLIYMRTGSLIPGILLHSAGNAVNNFKEIAELLNLI